MNLDRRNIDIRTLAVEKTLEPLVLQVCSKTCFVETVAKRIIPKYMKNRFLQINIKIHGKNHVTNLGQSKF